MQFECHVVFWIAVLRVVVGPQSLLTAGCFTLRRYRASPLAAGVRWS